ncbi:hypothetical protein [Telluria beijingensis]|uniref:hypothetical protein n=1 Tax=Telluria beijingensis TaxID=3068633 RepID=UPI0027960D76|nr:hypothetical protein [Massilia sp. REN29]
MTAREYARRRKTFEREMLKALAPALKGSGWKKSGHTLFRQAGAYFLQIDIGVHAIEEKTVLTHRIKPMALDPILWDILGMPENAHEPLSLRARGAFTCWGIAVDEVVDEGRYESGIAAAASIAAFARRSTSGIDAALANMDFSERLAAHPWQVERGVYAVELVVSLINDGDWEAAARLAAACEHGECAAMCGFSSGGKSFHRLALEWIEAGKALSRFSR